jgi:predicted RNA-binding protein YlqC (UPF0109 family)
MHFKTVGDLKKILDQYPDDMEVVRTTTGHFCIHKNDMSTFSTGKLIMNGGKTWKEIDTVVSDQIVLVIG